MSETGNTPQPGVSEAWGPLHGWACAQRPDWDHHSVKAAMREASTRRALYRDVAVILWRLAWDPEAGTGMVLGELSALNRTGGIRKGTPPAGLVAALKAGNYEAAREIAAGQDTS